MQRKNADRGEETVEAKDNPVPGFEPSGEPFQGEQAGQEAKDHSHQTRQKEMDQRDVGVRILVRLVQQPQRFATHQSGR